MVAFLPVAMEFPQSGELAGGRVEEPAAGQRQLAGPGQQIDHLAADGNGAAVRQRLVDALQFATGLEGVTDVVQ